jgi:hypothetical protein
MNQKRLRPQRLRLARPYLAARGRRGLRGEEVGRNEAREGD